MSFFINNTEPSEAYFNGSEVSTIYYNGTLIWKANKFDWGDETAIGDSAWWLALKEWAVSTTAAERKACVGKTKKMSLSTAVLEANAFTMRCIAADEDGEGTLTFDSAYLAPDTTKFGSSAVWVNSALRNTYCANIYNYCSAKSAIKTVKKGTCSNYSSSSRNGTVTYNNETVFVLSERELGLNANAPISAANSTTTNAECTQGYNAAYSYFKDNASRKKPLGDANGDATTNTYNWDYPTRSRHCTSANSKKVLTIVNQTGVESNTTYSSNVLKLAPAFVIG